MKKFLKLMRAALDKQAHFGWGAMICAFFTIVTLLQGIGTVLPWGLVLHCITGTAAALVFAVIKEMADPQPDRLDIAATLAGTPVIWAAVALGILFNHLSNA